MAYHQIEAALIEWMHMFVRRLRRLCASERMVVEWAMKFGNGGHSSKPVSIVAFQ